MQIGRNSRRNRGPREASELGFTLLEMMIVITILMVLLALGAAHYDLVVVHAREAALRQDITEMDQAIQDYTRDKEAAPTSLDDLVPVYLGRIPNDPVTGAKDWVTDTCPDLLSVDQDSTGICSVHSGSNQVSPITNQAYSEWEPE
ncbi:MAG TPA: type II secretion system protein [Candidatus Acidoferrum sp.]|nr:type II secretion system protein [Candidatus Acidoferrum sp.]